MTFNNFQKLDSLFIQFFYIIYSFKKRHFSRKSMKKNFSFRNFTLNKTSFKNELLIKI
jgi:hypothetical protein